MLYSLRSTRDSKLVKVKPFELKVDHCLSKIKSYKKCQLKFCLFPCTEYSDSYNHERATYILDIINVKHLCFCEEIGEYSHGVYYYSGQKV